MIREKKVTKTVEKILQPAHYKEIDTGHRRELEIIKKDGRREIKERPIIERIFVEAVKENIDVNYTVYAYNDGTDDHDFATQEDAQRFLKQIGKA